MTKVMFAQRDIRKGEELCGTYLSEMRLRQSKTERSRMLCSWIGIDETCGCSRCWREG